MNATMSNKNMSRIYQEYRQSRKIIWQCRILKKFSLIILRNPFKVHQYQITTFIKIKVVPLI